MFVSPQADKEVLDHVPKPARAAAAGRAAEANESKAKRQREQVEELAPKKAKASFAVPIPGEPQPEWLRLAVEHELPGLKSELALASLVKDTKVLPKFRWL